MIIPQALLLTLQWYKSHWLLKRPTLCVESLFDNGDMKSCSVEVVPMTVQMHVDEKDFV